MPSDRIFIQNSYQLQPYRACVWQAVKQFINSVVESAKLACHTSIEFAGKEAGSPNGFRQFHFSGHRRHYDLQVLMGSPVSTQVSDRGEGPGRCCALSEAVSWPRTMSLGNCFKGGLANLFSLCPAEDRSLLLWLGNRCVL